ncbi:MAG TPA: class I SAM-dependent methyltransferase [Anaerolineales bacterium]
MKARQSGMPDEPMWDQFFDPDFILRGLGIQNLTGRIVDLGCGYGTFTIPAAQLNQGTIYALDIESEMIKITQEKARTAGLKNVQTVQRDFVTLGTGLPDDSCEYVMLFNILHAEEPVKILTEARRILQPGGRIGVIHWIHDASTPRGPSLDIRPKPEQCISWLLEASFRTDGKIIQFPPYHYGLVGEKV